MSFGIDKLFENRVQGIIDETCEWALTGIAKGISDVHLTFENVPPWDIDGSVVMNNDNGVISMKGWLYGVYASGSSKASPRRTDKWCFIDLDVEWKSDSPKLWKQFQKVELLEIKDVMKMNRRRSQAKEGILPLEFQQSINRKNIVTDYGTDGAFYV